MRAVARPHGGAWLALLFFAQFAAGCELPVDAAGNTLARQARSRDLPAGSNPIRAVNPNDFGVELELRSGAASRRLRVPAGGDAQTLVGDGRFDITFRYDDEPGACYAGDAFSLDHRGIEIRIIKSTSGRIRHDESRPGAVQ